MDDNTEKYGHVWGYMEGVRPTLVLSDVEMMKQIYIKEFSKFYSRKVNLLTPLNHSFGNGLQRELFCLFLETIRVIMHLNSRYSNYF